MDYEVEGVRPRGGPKKSWNGLIEEDYQTQQICKEILLTIGNGVS